MENTNEYQYYRLEKKHFRDLKYIFKKVFNKKVSIDYLTQKYDCSYLGIDPVATIAYNGKSPIAFYGSIPQLFSNGKDDFLIAHACDSFTLPEYQKQGLHYNLALKSYGFMKACGIKMVYAYHSENTYYSTKKLHWKEHVEMKRFHVFTDVFPTAKVFNKLNLNQLLVRKITQVLKPFITENAENPFAIESKIYHCYSKTFFEYKEGFNRHYTVCINNCTFYLKFGAILQVGYFDFPTIESLKKAIDTLKKLVMKIGVSEILFQVDPGSKQNEGLSTLSKGYQSWLIGYLLFDETLDITKIGFNYADLDTF